MAIKHVVPGKTDGQLTAKARSSKIPPALQHPPGGLYPLQSSAWEVDEYRIMAGWPVPVPEHDIRIDCLVVGDGTKLGDRDTPSSLVTAADMRWIADADFYDEISLRWHPIQGTEVSSWTTGTDHSPTLVTDYSYTINTERFLDYTALNFDSDTGDYMEINLDLIMGGTLGYTLVMVMSPNSIYTTDDTILERALWGPQTTDGAWTMFTFSDQSIWMQTEEQVRTRGVAVGTSLNSSAPSYLAMVVRRPQTTLYVASGPSNVQSKALPAGAAPEPLSTRFWLGNGPFSTVGTMDMALLDLGIYGNPLTKDQVVDEFTALSTIYGGDK